MSKKGDGTSIVKEASSQTQLEEDVEKHTESKKEDEATSVRPEALKNEEEDIDPKMEDEAQQPKGMSILLVMISIYLSLFLVALDRTIIATAIPRITDDFNSLEDVGWYGSAYTLTMCASQLLFGRIYTFYSPKAVFLASIFIFEVGSTICGAAPSSIALIIGRAIAGLGSAGVFSGIVVIIMHSIPLRKRPIYMGFMGAVFGVASVAGPILGGAFTDHVSWRWCFYINLPLGGFSVAVLVLVLRIPTMVDNMTFKEKMIQLDPLGTVIFMPSIVCLLLALQWGGAKYAWSDGRIIALLVIFSITLLVFVAVEIWRGESATVPPRIIRQRSIASGVWFTTCIGGGMLVLVYYLPFWFQAIKDASAVKSGIMNLPMLLGVVLFSIISGALVTMSGFYTPFMIGSSVFFSIGCGLLTTFTTTTGHEKWIGYQVLAGMGLGLGVQQTATAANAVLDKKDVPTGTSLMFFAQGLGGAVFISVAQNILSNKLISGLSGVEGIDARVIANTGATELRHVVDSSLLDLVLNVYNDALTDVFKVALVLGCCSLVGAVAMEWVSVKGKRPH
ncbi:MFS general substrate transporter [Patellaria atrata CBS 101060]|uniref:MFS general substrate transporter n=1 Tax=Patellaria atrata CBS 101060 TaxID=1346257 RepID=A0A9P4S5E8_9PEZI|nr:MFS general substrate transporter [Patellaria atrata CBS 101060]